MSANNLQPSLPGMGPNVPKPSRRPSGHVRDYGDRVDKGSAQLEVEPGAVLPENIAQLREAMAQAALSTPNSAKALNMLAALEMSARANSSGGIAHVLADPDHPEYEKLRQYFDGGPKKAEAREANQRDTVKAMIAAACGTCALRDTCLYYGNPGAMAHIMADAETRGPLVKGIERAVVAGQDYDCMEIIRPGSRDEAKRKRKKLNESKKARRSRF